VAQPVQCWQSYHRDTTLNSIQVGAARRRRAAVSASGSLSVRPDRTGHSGGHHLITMPSRGGSFKFRHFPLPSQLVLRYKRLLASLCKLPGRSRGLSMSDGLVHRFSSSNVADIECDECGKRYTRPQFLDAHQRNHCAGNKRSLQALLEDARQVWELRRSRKRPRLDSPTPSDAPNDYSNFHNDLPSVQLSTESTISAFQQGTGTQWVSDRRVNSVPWANSCFPYFSTVVDTSGSPVTATERSQLELSQNPFQMNLDL
jgi:hypothetical protein